MKPPSRRELLEASPEWWHAEGAKIEVKKVMPSEIYLASRATRASLSHIRVEDQKAGRAWKLRFSTFTAPDHRMDFEVALETPWLRGIFCGEPIKPGRGIDRLHLSSGVSGVFIRLERFASILAPHSRGYVCPILSIWIDDEMPKAVDHLIKRNCED